MIEYADIMAAIEKLRTDVTASLTEIRNDIDLNLVRTDRGIDGVMSLRLELTHLAAEVAAMERQIQRLQADVRQLRGER
jgi:hypothetical protein